MRSGNETSVELVPWSFRSPSASRSWQHEKMHSKWCMSNSPLMSLGLMSSIRYVILKCVIYKQLIENILGRHTDGFQTSVCKAELISNLYLVTPLMISGMRIFLDCNWFHSIALAFKNVFCSEALACSHETQTCVDFGIINVLLTNFQL